MPFSSAMPVILLHIRTVINLRMLDGTVIGLYMEGWRESPPYKRKREEFRESRGNYT